ncbi:MAG: hypothetical protein R3E91_05750 [Chlamydiales bacterium]
MKVKINEKLICIPPHISTTWEHVKLLQAEENSTTKKYKLILRLAENKIVEIPEIEAALIDIAFSSHMKYLEGKSRSDKPEGGNKTFGSLIQQLMGLSPEQLSNIPIRFGISGGIPGIENLESAFQHNQEQADTPDMPLEVLEKAVGMAKLFMGGDLEAFPKPEPHCNCTHCQLARAIHHIPKNDMQEDSLVTEEDLKFRTWNIKESSESDKIYIVTNPLDSKEHYTVYLGTPLGCTCGQANCEHIKAVLLHS